MTSRYVNPLAWVADGLKTWPEPVTGPDWLDELTPLEMAEARSRLQDISRVATELRRIVDLQLVAGLNGAALRYGDTIMRAAGPRGRPKVKDEPFWWAMVIRALKNTPSPARLLAALFPANSVKLSGLPFLAAALGEEPDALRDEHLTFELPSSPLATMPLSRAPKYLQKLEEGTTSYDRTSERQQEIVEQLKRAAEIAEGEKP